MEQDDKVFPLVGTIQHYAWGGDHFLPGLLSVTNPEKKPFAEYWLGAHVNAPSELVIVLPADGREKKKGQAGSSSVRLDEFIGKSPATLLGKYTAERWGRLPYLLKLLDVRDMLSIQVHPSKKNAEMEFLAENTKGIPLNAPNRNYKDDNHKPELMMALSDFWLLHGFKTEADLEKTFSRVPELAFLSPILKAGGYPGLYRKVMEMPQADVNRILQSLLDRIIPVYAAGRLSKDREDFWAARAALSFNEPGRIDRGIFSIYLFNLVNLQPGEAIFQDAGLPHAYLEGQNVEIMANSDNVLRGGLTPKHVDVPQLLKHIKFEPTLPRIIQGDNSAGHIAIFHTPAPDFELARISFEKGESITINAHSVEIFFVLEGKLGVVENIRNRFPSKQGNAFLVFDKGKVVLEALEYSLVFRAAVPMPKG